MTITNGYCTLTQLQGRVLSVQAGGGYATDTVRDRMMSQQIEAASRWIDAQCFRKFYTTIETRYFTPRHGDWLPVDDLISITTLKSDDTATRGYNVTWATTDYDLEPYNARNLTPARPYNALRVTPIGLNYFPSFYKGVEIVGKWGYSDQTTTASTLSGGVSASTTTFPVADGTAYEVGHIGYVDSEQVFIDAISSNNLTVRRGVNGTTAATHDSGASLYIFQFDSIAEACAMEAHRLFARKAAILGVAGTTTLGNINMRVPKDSDIQDLISGYKRPPL